MGEEIPEQLDYKPAQVRVIRNIRPKYVCPCCSSVAIAPVPMQLFPKSLATSSLTAMDVQAVIGIYIDSIAARLPYRLRNDVGVELRTLLMEQLAAAADAGRAPDEKLAVDLVRGFGLPEEVAARYSPRGFEIIEPAHARVFVTLSALCVVLQWAFTLPAVFALRVTLRDWWRGSGFGALAWGACWSSGSVSGRGFIAPAWFLGFLTHNGTDTSWALYDEGFRRSMLPVLIVLMVVRLALCAMAGVNGRLRARLDLVRFALWVVLRRPAHLDCLRLDHLRQPCSRRAVQGVAAGLSARQCHPDRGVESARTHSSTFPGDLRFDTRQNVTRSPRREPHLPQEPLAGRPAD